MTISTGMIKIDAGIPMPYSMNKKYPFQDMKVGDSFFVPVKDGLNIQYVRNSIMGAARTIRVKPMKFATRIIEGGVRCWRIK